MEINFGSFSLLVAGLMMAFSRFDEKPKSRRFFGFLVAIMILAASTSHAEEKTFCRTKDVPVGPSKTFCIVDYGWIGTDGNCLKVVFERWKCDPKQDNDNSPYWMTGGAMTILLEEGGVQTLFRETEPSGNPATSPTTPAPRISTAKVEKKVDGLAELEKERIAAEKQRIAEEKAAREAEKQAEEKEKAAEKVCKTNISNHNQGVRDCTRGIKQKKNVLQRVFDQYDNKDEAEYEIGADIIACTCGVEEESSMCEDNAEYQPAATLNLGECVKQAGRDVFSFGNLF